MKLFDVKWKIQTAGPSPDDNNRTEVFLFGCEKAKSGNPCKGCFNSVTWDDSVVTITHTPEEIAEKLIEFSPNKYITIGGGEPTDQIEELITLCKILKKNDFHILVYTWKSLHDIIEIKYGDYFREKTIKLLNYIDILVDGDFRIDEKVYNEDLGDGAFNSVGSANQIVWDVNRYKHALWQQSMNVVPYITGEAMSNIKGLWIDKEHNNDLKYVVDDLNKEQKVYI